MCKKRARAQRADPTGCDTPPADRHVKQTGRRSLQEQVFQVRSVRLHHRWRHAQIGPLHTLGTGVCVCVYVCPDTMLHHTIKGITARRSFGYVRNRRLYHAWPRMARGIIAPNSSATKRAGGCDKIGARSCGTANIHIDAKPIHSTPSASVSCTHIRTFTGIIRVADPMKQASMWYSIRTRRRAKQLFFGPWGRRTKPA